MWWESSAFGSHDPPNGTGRGRRAGGLGAGRASSRCRVVWCCWRPSCWCRLRARGLLRRSEDNEESLTRATPPRTAATHRAPPGKPVPRRQQSPPPQPAAAQTPLGKTAAHGRPLQGDSVRRPGRSEPNDPRPVADVEIEQKSDAPAAEFLVVPSNGPRVEPSNSQPRPWQIWCTTQPASLNAGPLLPHCYGQLGTLSQPHRRLL